MDLKPLFEPKTMAVIGVSLHNDLNPANVIYYKNYLRYPVDTYAVNPKAGLLKGQRAFSSISELPVKVDLAVIAAQAERVPGIMEECIKAGVGGAAIISGGFAESGRADLQERIVAIAREADFPFVGPNCLGMYSHGRMDTFFIPTERMGTPRKGNVAVISQSGGILVDLMIRFSSAGVGMSLGVSIGNKALLKEKDLLGYLANDPDTQVIAFYIEGFSANEGHDFVEAAQRVGKPVVVLKAGKSPGATTAITSHTASLAGDYAVFSSVLSQYGLVEAKNMLELVYFCQGLSAYQKPTEGRLGIITASGGHGALAMDLCMEMDLSVPTLHEIEQDAIRRLLSPTIKPIAACMNPVDVTGSAVDQDFVAAAMTMGMHPEIDCLVALILPYAPGITQDLGAILGSVPRRSGKPLIAYVARLDKYRILIEGFELNGVPVAHSIEGAMYMAQALMKYKGRP
ncbi:MAG TPA: CoA-binding protein [Deltaproteobacteria bacterium]|nr:CoA-binding protein [Deltaproteobacteria bacterium]